MTGSPRRRPDLSTYLVHFTRRKADQGAIDILKRILGVGDLNEGPDPRGHAVGKLRNVGWSDVLDRHRSICCTETPLQFAHLLAEHLSGRDIQLEPYGVAFPVNVARSCGFNPVWYLDQTKGHDWLTKSVDALIDDAINANNQGAHIFRLTPFIEQFGVGKDFHWEREWRLTRETFKFRFIKRLQYVVLCPRSEVDGLKLWFSQEIGGNLPPFIAIDASEEVIMAEVSRLPQ